MYRVIQRDPTSWYETGENVVVREGGTHTDLYDAIVESEARTVHGGECAPTWEVASDDPDDYNEYGDVDTSHLDIDEEAVFDALVRMGRTEQETMTLLGYGDDYGDDDDDDDDE